MTIKETKKLIFLILTLAFWGFWLLYGPFSCIIDIFSPPRDLTKSAPTIEDKLAIDEALYGEPAGPNLGRYSTCPP